MFAYGVFRLVLKCGRGTFCPLLTVSMCRHDHISVSRLHDPLSRFVPFLSPKTCHPNSRTRRQAKMAHSFFNRPFVASNIIDLVTDATAETFALAAKPMKGGADPLFGKLPAERYHHAIRWSDNDGRPHPKATLLASTCSQCFTFKPPVCTVNTPDRTAGSRLRFAQQLPHRHWLPCYTIALDQPCARPGIFASSSAQIWSRCALWEQGVWTAYCEADA